MALAEKAAVEYQVQEDEAGASSNYVEFGQSEELEADAEHEQDSGLTANEDETESMEIDGTPHEFSQQEINTVGRHTFTP